MFTDVSGQPVGPIEDKTDGTSVNNYQHMLYNNQKSKDLIFTAAEV
jgi:hypothetical protein